MVVIRLARAGAKKKPFYHVVIADSRRSRDGRYIKKVGLFDPMARGNSLRLRLDHDVIAEWVQKGAQPSERVSQLLKEYEEAGNTEIKGEAQETRIKAKHDVKAAKKAAEAAAAKAAEEAEAKKAAEAEASADTDTPAEEPAAE